jgi:hypothetical protein
MRRLDGTGPDIDSVEVCDIRVTMQLDLVE